MSDDVRIDYENGYYIGEVSPSGDEEGLGMFRWSNGNSYVGRWHSGMKHGRGTFRVPGKWVYEGDFDADPDLATRGKLNTDSGA